MDLVPRGTVLSLAWREGRQSFREVSREELLCTLLASQLVCAQHCLGGVFFGEGRRNNLEFMGKNAFKQSVDELTAKLQFVSY